MVPRRDEPGADFGGGVWDLLASGPRKREQRALIEHAIGPIWEVPPDLTLAAASAPRGVQVAMLWALGVGAILLFPALFLLFRTFKGERPFSVIDRRP